MSDKPELPPLAGDSAAIDEARRQVQICNACRYCEGFCAVFPAIQRRFSDGDISHLADLCHNCRGCYYACRYTDPHEFAIKVPAALARVRSSNWQHFAFPAALARLFHRHGVAVAGCLVLCLAVMIAATGRPGAEAGGFYASLSHNAMVAIFMPAFVLPLLFLTSALYRHWHCIWRQYWPLLSPCLVAKWFMAFFTWPHCCAMRSSIQIDKDSHDGDRATG